MANVNCISSSSVLDYFQRAEEISKIESPTSGDIRELFECYKNNPRVISLFFGGFRKVFEVAKQSGISHRDITRFVHDGYNLVNSFYAGEPAPNGYDFDVLLHEYSDEFVQNGVVITQINYKKGDEIAESRGRAFIVMLQLALSRGVSMYIINDGVDDYWKGELEYVLDMASKNKNLSQNVQKIRIVDSTEEEMNLPFAQRRQLAVEHVLGNEAVKYIYWTEPEKSDLLLEGNLARVGAGFMDGNMILIPTAKPHDDRPKYMQTTEMVSERVLEFLLENQERIRENKGKLPPVSEFLQEYHGSNGVIQQPENPDEFYDYYFGPFVVERSVAEEYFIGDKDWKHWDYNVLAKAFAQYDGIPTTSLPVRFSYPESQKAFEESNAEKMIPYRLRQSNAITQVAIRKIREGK